MVLQKTREKIKCQAKEVGHTIVVRALVGGGHSGIPGGAGEFFQSADNWTHGIPVVGREV